MQENRLVVATGRCWRVGEMGKLFLILFLGLGFKERALNWVHLPCVVAKGMERTDKRDVKKEEPARPYTCWLREGYDGEIAKMTLSFGD